MHILLIGNGNYYHIAAFFQRALKALGLEFLFIDDQKFFKLLHKSFFHKSAYRLFSRPLGYQAFNHEIVQIVRSFRPDVIIIPKGAFISLKTLAQIKDISQALLVNYATDDPFNSAVRNTDIPASIPFYDVYACTKRAIIKDVKDAGCANAIYMPFGYEPSLHFPEKVKTSEDLARFSSDLVFIGGADSDRLPLITKIVEMSSIDVHLYGGYWNRDIQLRKFYHGFALGHEFRLALGETKIGLGLVRHANRDGHSMRSFEIPACGSFMLAERTEEHLELFIENKEAVYFNSDEELLDKVKYYIFHDIERQRIANAGFQRVNEGHHTYQDRMIQLLEVVKELI